MKYNYIWRSAKYFFRMKKATFYSILMCVIGLLVGIFTPIANSFIVNEIIPNKNIGLFIALTFVVLILQIASILSAYFNTNIMIENGVPISTNIRHDIVKMNSFATKNINSRGNVSIASTNFLEELNTFYISYLNCSYDSILKLMFYLPFFFVYGKTLSLVIFIAIVFILVIDNLLAMRALDLSLKSRQADVIRQTYLIKMYDAMKDPNFEENDEVSYEKYRDSFRLTEKAWIKYNMCNNLFNLVETIFWYGAMLLTFILAYNQIVDGVITLGAFVVFNSYCVQLLPPISQFTTVVKISNQYNMSFRTFFVELDDEELQPLKK